MKKIGLVLVSQSAQFGLLDWKEITTRSNLSELFGQGESKVKHIIEAYFDGGSNTIHLLEVDLPSNEEVWGSGALLSQRIISLKADIVAISILEADSDIDGLNLHVEAAQSRLDVLRGELSQQGNSFMAVVEGVGNKLQIETLPTLHGSVPIFIGESDDKRGCGFGYFMGSLSSENLSWKLGAPGNNMMLGKMWKIGERENRFLSKEEENELANKGYWFASKLDGLNGYYLHEEKLPNGKNWSEELIHIQVQKSIKKIFEENLLSKIEYKEEDGRVEEERLAYIKLALEAQLTSEYVINGPLKTLEITINKNQDLRTDELLRIGFTMEIRDYFKRPDTKIPVSI